LSYKVVKSSNFIRAAKRFNRKYDNFSEELNSALVALLENPFASNLKTHKLKGQLSDYWACSINYSLRIIFKFVKAIDKDDGKPVEAILLSTIGTHDEIY
jgi:addiction module RelE/StbE family toxin